MKFREHLESLNEVTLNKDENINKELTFKSLSNGINKKRTLFLNSLGFNELAKIVLLDSSTRIAKKDIHEIPKAESNDVTIFSVNGKKIGIKSKISYLEKFFTHKKDSKGSSKSSTHDSTEMKELVSMWIFKHGIISEDKIKKMVNKETDVSYTYKSIFYESALKQYKEYKKLGINGKFFERQMGPLSSILYNKAKVLSAMNGTPISNKDNWNPADVWVFTNKGKQFIDNIDKITSFIELNDKIKELLLTKDMIGISLKQVSKKTAVLKYNNIGEELISDLDFSISKIDVPLSFKSINFISKSGYFLKCNMRGSSETLNINMEGRFTNKNYSEGAYPADIWNIYKRENNINVFSGESTPELTETEFNKLRKIFIEYNNLLNNNLSSVEFKDLSVRDGQRYSIIATHLREIMKTPEKILKASFFGSQKLHNKASAFVKISE